MTATARLSPDRSGPDRNDPDRNDPDRNDPDRSHVEQVLISEIAGTAKAPGRTKRTAVRLAILNTIQSGDLAPGDFLPPEKRLTEILGVSLGTVQAALRQLQQLGVIVRRRGDGTRVASTEPLDSSIWHFRFVTREDGVPLRVARIAVELDEVTEQGDWAGYITGCQCFVRIRRRYTMSNGSHAGSEMFLDKTTVPGLMELGPGELDTVNIRPYLEEKFGIVTAGATHEVRTTSLDRRTARIFDLPSKDLFFEIHAKAFANDRRPVYFQRIYVSVNDCALTF